MCLTDEENVMPYVKWNQTKYHIVDAFTPDGTRIKDGRVTAIPVGNQTEGGPAYTMCGRAIPDDNVVFERLPDGVDQYHDVCSPCFAGPGIPKVPDTRKASDSQIAPSRSGDASNKTHDELLSKVRQRQNEAAREMFGPNASSPED